MIAIYARQSVDKKDSISIEGQIELCQKSIVERDIKVYKDKGFSGKNINRPDFQRLLEDIENGIISKVVVYKLDRMSRSLLDFANLMDIFKKNKVEFVSCTENFDTSTPIGIAMLSIVMVFAELERKTIQQRTRDNYYQRGEKGMYLGGVAPYGMKKVTERIAGKKITYLVPNEETINIVKEIYDTYAWSDVTLGTIVKHLNEQGIYTNKGYMWDNTRIARILKSPIYVKANADIYVYYKNRGCNITNSVTEFTGEHGCYLYGKREPRMKKFTDVKGHYLTIAPHEGVIDANEWLVCQQKLSENIQIQNAGKGKYSWLSGLIKCGKCGYAMSCIRTKGILYLRCSGKINKKMCDGQDIPQHIEDIEHIVETNLLDKIKELSDIKLIEEKREVSNRTIDEYKIQIVDIDSKIDTLVDSLTNLSNVSVQIVDKKINELAEQKNRLLEKIEEEQKKISSKPKDTFLDIPKKWVDMRLEEKKAIAKQFINKIVLLNHDIDIQWKVY